MSTAKEQIAEDPEVDKILDNLLSRMETKVSETHFSDHSVRDNADKLSEGSDEMEFVDPVLEYLMRQEQYVPGEDIDIQDFSVKEKEPREQIEETAKLILSQLIGDVNNITAFKEAHAKRKEYNNQFELFDLTTKIPNFHINDKVMDMMAFRETLIISKVDKDGQVEPVGGLCLDVQVAQGAKWDKPKKPPDFTEALLKACIDVKNEYSNDPKEQPTKDLDECIQFLRDEMHQHFQKFLVHLSTQFNVDGKNAGSRITSWVDRNLHTLEEKRAEYIMLTNNDHPGVDQKQIYIYIGKNHYDVRVCPGEEFCKKYCYSFRRAKDFVGEAANFILMRYLAIVKFIGEFELSSIHIEGGLCKNIYKCEGPMGGYINNEKLDVYKVYRTIVEECGIIQRSCTVLSSDGRIMKHDWEKCDYVLQINPIISPNTQRSTLVLHFDEAWKDDLQLFSKYLDKKVSTSLEMKTYLFDHKDIGNLIKDYVQNILQIKPENIIKFTKYFFLSYAPYLLPRAEYFEEDVNKCIYSVSNDKK